MHVLIVEGEAILAKQLQRLLHADAATSFTVNTRVGLQTLFALKDYSDPDVVLMDRFINHEDLTDEIKLIRRHWPKSRIVILCATGSSKERANLINQGVDDYMIKPFDPDELLARLRRAYSRKIESQMDQGGVPSWLKIDENAADLVIDNQRLHLNHREYLLAKIFVEHPNKVFSRGKLVTMLWELDSETESNVLEVTISHLRKKARKINPAFKICSRRNLGYYLDVTL